jgi:hypothetical protein
MNTIRVKFSNGASPSKFYSFCSIFSGLLSSLNHIAPAAIFLRPGRRWQKSYIAVPQSESRFDCGVEFDRMDFRLVSPENVLFEGDCGETARRESLKQADVRHERSRSDQFKGFVCADLLKRDKVNLDIFWLRDESLEDSANLPDPGVLALEIAEELEAALEQFTAIAEDLKR